MFEEDLYMYAKRLGDDFLIFMLYVDDLVITGSDLEMIVANKGWLSFNFETKDMDETN